MILIKDAADDNAYDYDTTSTLSVKRLESLRENFPENYHPDTVIDMAQPDIGYHYLRRIANDDPINDSNREVIITFKQPEPGPGGIEKYEIYSWIPGTGWQDIGDILKDQSSEYIHYNLNPNIEEEGNFKIMVDTNPEFGINQENGPEINIIIDTQF